MFTLPTIYIKYESKKTENEVYTVIIDNINKAIAVITYEPNLLRNVELNLKEALSIVKSYQDKLYMRDCTKEIIELSSKGGKLKI